MYDERWLRFTNWATGQGFDLLGPQYIQLKPKGAGVTLYFTTEFMRKNQRPNQVNDPWYIPAVPTGKPGFGALNCPVKPRLHGHAIFACVNACDIGFK